MDLSSFRQTFDVATAEKSLDMTLNKNDHVSRLLVKKAELETALETELAKIEKARCNLKSLVNSINDEHRKVDDAHVTAQAMKWNAGRNMGFHEWILHSNTVWGHKYPDSVKNDTLLESNRIMGTADATNAIVAQGNVTLRTHVAQASNEDAAIAASHKEIVRLRGEIEKVTKEILSILER